MCVFVFRFVFGIIFFFVCGGSEEQTGRRRRAAEGERALEGATQSLRWAWVCPASQGLAKPKPKPKPKPGKARLGKTTALSNIAIPGPALPACLPASLPVLPVFFLLSFSHSVVVSLSLPRKRRAKGEPDPEPETPAQRKRELSARGGE